MEGSLGVVAVLAIGLTLVVVVGVLGYLGAQRRRDEMAAYAASRGWRYETQQPALVDRFPGAPFGRGHSRQAFNVIYGRHDGRDFCSFDYRYSETSGSGEDRRTTTYRFSVLAMSLGVPVPDLEVSPENLFGRVIGRLTDSDIELESEDFNRAFTVRSPDRKFASDLLHPPMMEFLLAHPDVAWRLTGDSMLVIARGERSLDQIDWTLDLMDAITDRIPEFVWRDLKGQP